MLFNEADVVVSTNVPYLYQWFRGHLRDERQNGRVGSYGKASIVVPDTNSIELSDSAESSIQAAKYLMASAKLTQYVIENLGKLIAQALADKVDGKMLIKHAGLSLPLYVNYIPRDVATVSDTTVLERVGSVLEPDSTYENRYRLIDPFKPTFDGALSEAYALARANQYGATSFTDSLYQLGTTLRVPSQVGLDVVYTLSKTAARLTEHIPLSLAAVRDARNELLANKAQQSDTKRVERLATSRTNFERYWQTLKSDISKRVFPAEVTQTWDSIPLLEPGSNTSRTWGIEVETVQAQLVSRPRGWEATSDGSLESMGDNDGCSCDCSDCYDGYHDNCDEDGGECMEYVSPILSHFHSNGLRDLCGPLEHAPVNSTPGIHVHVGAEDLTITDVGRLVRAYSIVSPFIEHIAHRSSRNYCRDVTSQNLQYWLSAVRNAVKGDLLNYRTGEKLSASDIVAASWSQPDDRYHDLNVQSLGKHGTIEFRVMGPKYNYEHLIRWAWFCREMVNVSRLDIPVSVWTSVRSMADVVSVLRQYGSEIPSDEYDKDTHALANAMNGEYDYVDA
jgi:hypothetical protein